MKVNKLNNDVFFDFASRKMGINVKLFNNDMEFKRSEKVIKLHFYIGGESADSREFLFTDDSCVFIEGNFNGKRNLSREWAMYLTEEVCDSEEEARYYVDAYNRRLESKIAQYAKEKRDMMISL